MRTFFEPLQELKEFHDIKENLVLKNTPIHVTGCIDSQKCHLMSGIGIDYKYKIIITHNDIKAKEIYEDYKLYDKGVFLYPAKDIIFYSADIHSNAITKDRLTIIKRLLNNEPTTIVTTLDGGIDRILPLNIIKSRIITIEEGGILDLDKLKAELVHLGYEREGQVEGPGQFAIRGGIIDIYPLTEDCPYRIELWDDEIDTIRSFDLESQRSIENITSLEIYPATEAVLDDIVLMNGLKKIKYEMEEQVKALRNQKLTEEAHRLKGIIEEFQDNISSYGGMIGIESYINYFYQNTVSFFDYFSNEDTCFYLDEPARVIERGKAIEIEFRESMIGRIEKGYILPGQSEAIYSCQEIIAKLNIKNTLLLSTMEYKVAEILEKVKFTVTTKSVNPYNNHFDVLVKDLTRWKDQGYRVILLSSSRTRAKRLSEDLREYELNTFYGEDLDRILQPGEIIVVNGNLRKGFEYPLIKLVIISESDIFGREKRKKKKRKTYEGNKIQSFNDLSVGDYVVHENHGLGIYKGIEKIEVDKVAKDYIKIEYAAGGALYILATGLDVIQKYASADSKKPKLNKLNSIEWKNTKKRVKGAVKEVAKELVELYAIRQAKEGYQYSEDTVWQREFEEMFPYEETDDQLLAIESTKKDMESKRIMDRLICGDVGYGKTEIAIRAAFKAVSDGKQVVILVPTTILAQQHYNTFVQRMMDFPISIDMLSRFKTPTEQKKALERLKKGSLDIIVGTHRILSKDVAFKNLGLLIIDEEQRFGVTHKEKMKQLKGDVDVLTLSATPIPRTLHMSLIGIRDMSVLEEPPVDRMPIQTYVLEYNEEIIKEALNREITRNGQVYYVYNRVNNIDEVANMISKLVPEANVAYAHGQMNERELEKIMYDFINGEIDVLVSTTIIETGLDISNVNTMIIHDADKLGLSQLYQLRGRVGRSNRTAYAFLMYKRDKMLKEIAEKRLQAIKEFTDLGSGFKIAMRDLEIRGAGNILGAQQHGHMEAVGYDLYCKMLNEAVKSLKGESVYEETFDTIVDIDIDAYIPSTYIKSEAIKLDTYKRIAEIGSEEEFLDMQEELIDRFGELPACVNNLLNIAYIKSLAHNAFITQVVHKEDEVKLVMYNKAHVYVEKIPVLVAQYKNALKFRPEANPYFIYQLKEKNKKGKKDIYHLLLTLRNLINDIKVLIE